MKSRADWTVHITTLALIGGVGAALVGLLSLLRAEQPDQIGAVVILPLGIVLTVAVARMLVLKNDLPFFWRLIAAGLLLRIGLAIVAHVHLPVAFFAPDQITYQDVGWRTLLYLREARPAPQQIRDSFEIGYFFWNAVLFGFFGFAPLVPKLFNCFFGVWSAIVAYRIGGEMVGNAGARKAGVLVMFFPSLILWSTQNLRDTPVVLTIMLILWIAIRLRSRPDATKLVALTILIGALVLLRDYMAVMIVFALVGTFLITPGRRMIGNVLIALILMGLSIVAYQQLGLGDRWISAASWDVLDLQRGYLAEGGSAFRPETDISSALGGIQYLPLGILFFLLAPFPWQIGSLLTVMTLPEQTVWYCLLPFVAVGVWFLLKERFATAQPIMIFLLLTTVIYALVEGNAGTAYRHRAQLVVFFLIIAAVGFEVRIARRNRGRRTRIASARGVDDHPDGYAAEGEEHPMEGGESVPT